MSIWDDKPKQSAKRLKGVNDDTGDDTSGYEYRGFTVTGRYEPQGRSTPTCLGWTASATAPRECDGVSVTIGDHAWTETKRECMNTIDLIHAGDAWAHRVWGCDMTDVSWRATTDDGDQ
jgi:hypothetical protein